MLALLSTRNSASVQDSNDRDRSQGTREHLLESLWKIFENAALRRPLVLIVDDLQWADSASREVLDVLSLRLGAYQLMLIGAERAEETQSGRTALASEDSQLLLEGLNEAALGQIVRAWVAYEVPATFTRALWTRTMGNPFFVSEILAHLRDSGLVYRRGRAMALDSSSIDAVRVTSNIADVLGRRFFRLPPSPRVTLACMAVLGEASTQDNLASQTGLDHQSLQEAVDIARTAGWIDGVEATLKFRHDLMREFVYREIPDEDRRALPRASRNDAGNCGRCERRSPPARSNSFASHRGRPGGGPRKRLQFTQAAGDAAFSVFAYEDAVKYWREALSIMEESLAPPADRARLLNVSVTRRSLAISTLRQAPPSSNTPCGSIGIWETKRAWRASIQSLARVLRERRRLHT